MTVSYSEQQQILNRLPVFDRQSELRTVKMSRMGGGEIGGKAHGLLSMSELLNKLTLDGKLAELTVTIPRMTVLTTEPFDLFMARNSLEDIANSDASDTRIANAFQNAEFPAEYVGDLMAFAESTDAPIAVRSSSRLEDALYRPFAGVYGTKMIPNNALSPTERFHKLMEAVKFVYASTYFREAKLYVRNIAESPEPEKMAVILQEVVGRRHGDRFYPDLSGVARSHNFYAMNWTLPQDGVVDLALGLGKTVVDGEATWAYSPALPQIGPPFNTISDLLKHTQLHFWAVNMGKPPAYDPINEAEFLVHPDLAVAEQDGTLYLTASTCDPESGRISPGIGRPGPRLLNFAPILQFEQVPLNELLKLLLELSARELGHPVEIEFAMTLEPDHALPARFAFLQVRPIVVETTATEVPMDIARAPNVLLASDNALGNGVVDTIEHLLVVRPDRFDWKHTPQIATELDLLNSRLIRERRNCVMIGFGRWGTTDEWRGIPVHVGQISTARVIVEATLPGMTVEPSQGSHFFHNLTSFRVLYFSVPHDRPLRAIDWDWLDTLEVLQETEFVRLLRAPGPLTVAVDGRTRHGVICHG